MKTILLLAGAYVLTLVLALTASGIVMIVLDPQNCHEYSQTLLILWLTIAAVFCFSLAAFGLISGRLRLEKTGRIIACGTYALLLLISYIFLALTLMLALNC
ncbi:hypothetical protein JXQ70_16135 [bacterium]|nr:hypothetical protein [bacterium]